MLEKFYRPLLTMNNRDLRLLQEDAADYARIAALTGYVSMQRRAEFWAAYAREQYAKAYP
jgi:hypothetical protein